MKTSNFLLVYLFLLPYVSFSQDSLYYPVDIVYDEVAGQYYVSNWADTENGYILLLDNDGQIIERFYDSLDYPCGMCLIDSILYIGNNLDLIGGSLPSFLIGIDLNTGTEILNTQISTDGTYLDLMTTDNNGNIYIGDSDKNKIYKYDINNDTVTEFIADIENPYGICYDNINDRILFTSGSFSISYVKSISPQGGNISTVFSHTGYLEGIIMDNSGNFYLSSWGDDYQWGNEPVYKTNNSFGWELELSNNHDRPFGMCIGFDNYLMVCNFGDHTLSFIDLLTSVEDANICTDMFKLFPNPSTGVVRLNFPGSTSPEIEISVMNIAGQTVHKEILKTNLINENTLDLDHLLPGTYFIMILDGQDLIQKKLILY